MSPRATSATINLNGSAVETTRAHALAAAAELGAAAPATVADVGEQVHATGKRGDKAGPT